MNQNDNSQEKSAIDSSRMIKVGKWLLGLGILFLIFTPWAFTRSLGIDWLDFTETGPIGDTIGGITAPFINLVGAALVYMSFLAQMRANEIQRKASNDQYKILLDEMEHRKYAAEKESINTFFKQTEDIWDRLDGYYSDTGIFHYLYNKLAGYDDRLNSLKHPIEAQSNAYRKVIVAMNKLSQLYDTIYLSGLDSGDRQMMFDQYTYLILERLDFFVKFSETLFKYENKKGMSKPTQQIFEAYKKEYESLYGILKNTVDERKI